MCWKQLCSSKHSQYNIRPPESELSERIYNEGEDPYLVAAPNQRAASDVQESQAFRDFLPIIKLRRLNVAVDFHVSLRGTHILTKGHNVHVDFSQL